MFSDGIGMFDEEGYRFHIGNQVIFQEPDCDCQETDCACTEQKEGDIGVIVNITTHPDKRDALDYIRFGFIKIVES